MPPKESPSDAALSRLRTICYGFLGTEEKLSHGMPSFHVRGKMFVHFVDNHHGDGHLAIWCHGTREKQAELVAAHPDRYFVPPYVGVRGWIGADLDRASTDWVELAILIEEGWLAVAPPKLARGEGKVAPRPPPPVRPTTDAKIARAALERLSKICLAFPGAALEKEGGHATFAVNGKNFVYFFDNHHGSATILACTRSDRAENDRLVKREPERYALPAYIGKRGWLGTRLESGKVDWRELTERIEASFAGVAPKPKAAPKSSAAKKTVKKRASTKPR